MKMKDFPIQCSTCMHGVPMIVGEKEKVWCGYLIGNATNPNDRTMCFVHAKDWFCAEWKRKRKGESK